MTNKPEAISRMASHALRHAPAEYGLVLDGEGWVAIDDLLVALQKKQSGSAAITRSDIESMVATAAKQRHEISGDRIRAMYGHSVPTQVHHVEAVPPTTLFHGTTPSAWEAIRVDGLRPMQRQHVHLSAEIATAITVGKRRANPPVILSVRAEDARAAGSQFWIGNDTIWLADFVPAEFLTVAP